MVGAAVDVRAEAVDDRAPMMSQRASRRLDCAHCGVKLAHQPRRAGAFGELALPKPRQGSYLPSLLEPRRTAEKALSAVIQEAYVHGVSPAAVDNLVQAMGGEADQKTVRGIVFLPPGVSKSEVSRLCAEIDEHVQAFLNRPIESEWPRLWIDATYLKARQGGRIVSTAVTVAVVVNIGGRRKVVGVATGPSEAEPFWTNFLRPLTDRGLCGVKLVIADAREGLRAAAANVLHAGLSAAASARSATASS